MRVRVSVSCYALAAATPASKPSSFIFRIQEHYYYYLHRARGSFGRISRLTLQPMKGAKTNKKNLSSEPNPLSLAYNVLTRLLFRTPPFRDPIFALRAPLWRCTFCQFNNPTQHTAKKCQRKRQKISST